DLRSFLADRRNEDVPAALGSGLSLLDPTHVDPFERLDLRGVVAEALEQELSAVWAGDGSVLDVIEAAEAESLDRVRQESMDRVPDGSLDLAGAEDAEATLDAVEQQRGCE